MCILTTTPMATAEPSPAEIGKGERAGGPENENDQRQGRVEFTWTWGERERERSVQVKSGLFFFNLKF